MATKNRPGAFDCYANAAPDEPMFVLLGRDPMAPMLIDLWAAMREATGEDPAKVEEARVCATACLDWARGLNESKGRRAEAILEILEEPAGDPNDMSHGIMENEIVDLLLMSIARSDRRATESTK